MGDNDHNSFSIIVAGTNGNWQLAPVCILSFTYILTIVSVIVVTAIEPLFGIETLWSILVEPMVLIILVIISVKAVFEVLFINGTRAVSEICAVISLRKVL